MDIYDNWLNLVSYKQRKDYLFVKADRSLLRSTDYTVEEKGLYLILLSRMHQLKANQGNVCISIDELLNAISTANDYRSIQHHKQLIVKTLKQLMLKKVIDGEVNDERINVLIDTDYVPFTQIYNVITLNIFPIMRSKSVKKSLRRLAVYGFVVASVGSENAVSAHIYTKGLNYIAKCLLIPYSTLKKDIEYLVNQQILARKTYTTRDRRKHTLLTTYTELDIQQLDNYVNSVFGKQPKQQQQQEEQRQETSQLVDNDLDNTPAKSHKSTTSYFDEVSDYVGFDVTDDKTILKIVKGWESHYTMQIVLTALDKLKYKIADFRPSSNLHMINWVNKLLTSGGYLDDVKAGLAEVSRVEELRKQGKVVDAKDIPNERIDFFGDEKDTDNSSIKVKKDLETNQETEDSDTDDVIEDIDFQAIADNIFKYN